MSLPDVTVKVAPSASNSRPGSVAVKVIVSVPFQLTSGIVIVATLFYSIYTNINNTPYGFSININLTKTSLILFLTANIIAIMAIAVITYYVFSFNKRGQVKAEPNSAKSKTPVMAFMESEEKYKVLMENLNDVVMMVKIGVKPEIF